MIKDEPLPRIIPDIMTYHSYGFYNISEKYRIKILNDYVLIDSAIIPNSVKKAYCDFALENERYETIDFKDNLKVDLQSYSNGIFIPIIEYNYWNTGAYVSIYENDKFNPLFNVGLLSSIKDTFGFNAYIMYKIFSTGPKTGKTKIILNNDLLTREQIVEKGINYLNLVKGDTLCLNYIFLKYLAQ
ncbi:MAG TPA: hypothetical protein VK590_15740 [Saprospiraceae bacterium]|nr:hypothetical protein [Saprospiraceae bacterium]